MFVWSMRNLKGTQTSNVKFPSAFNCKLGHLLELLLLPQLVMGSSANGYFHGPFRSLLPALSCVQTALLHLLDMGWEPSDLAFFVDIQLPDLLMKMSQENISVHDSVIR